MTETSKNAKSTLLTRIPLATFCVFVMILGAILLLPSGAGTYDPQVILAGLNSTRFMGVVMIDAAIAIFAIGFFLPAQTNNRSW